MMMFPLKYTLRERAFHFFTICLTDTASFPGVWVLPFTAFDKCIALIGKTCP